MDFYRKIAGPIIILSNFVVAGIINIYLFIYIFYLVVNLLCDPDQDIL